VFALLDPRSSTFIRGITFFQTKSAFLLDAEYSVAIVEPGWQVKTDGEGNLVLRQTKHLKKRTLDSQNGGNSWGVKKSLPKERQYRWDNIPTR
jgi:hypothetical protein